MTFAIGARRVEDYAKWKRAFDEGADLRRTGGMKSYRVFQTDGDPNHIVVLAEFDSGDDARKFLQSAELRDAEKSSGVVERFDRLDTSRFLVEVASGRCD